MSLLRGLKPKRPGAQGKTTDVSGGAVTICQACDDHEASLFCHLCLDALCKTCSKSHLKYFGESHTLTNLSDKSLTLSKLVPKSAEEAPEVSECVRHPGHEVTCVCKQCKALVCSVCSKDVLHKGHKIVNLEEDPQLLIEICNLDVKLLLDALSKIDTFSTARGQSERPLDDAIQQLRQKQADLIRLINDRVDKSVKQLEKEKKSRVNKKKSTTEKVSNNKDRMEFNVTQLNTARKARDISTMVAEMCRCDHIMNDVGEFLKEHEHGTRETYTVADLIPGLGEYNKVSRRVVGMFDVMLPKQAAAQTGASTSGDTNRTREQKTKQRFEYKRLGKLRSTEVGNRFANLLAAESLALNNTNTVTMYAPVTDAVSVIDYRTGEETRITAQCELSKCIHLSKQRFVAMEHHKKNLQLLNRSFSVLDTVTQPDNMIRLCCLDEKAFVGYSTQNQNPDRIHVWHIINDKITHFKTISISKQLPTDDNMECMGISTNPDSSKITLIFTGYGKSEICIVNLKTAAVRKFTVNVVVVGNSPYIDQDGNLLLCTKEKKIHVYRDIEHGVRDVEVLDNIVIDENDCAKGITRHSDSLILGYWKKVEHYSLP